MAFILEGLLAWVFATLGGVVAGGSLVLGGLLAYVIKGMLSPSNAVMSALYPARNRQGLCLIAATSLGAGLGVAYGPEVLGGIKNLISTS